MNTDNNRINCCWKKRRIFWEAKISGMPLTLSIAEWISWVTGWDNTTGEVCKDCEVFWIDSVKALDWKTSKEDKDAYFKKHFG